MKRGQTQARCQEILCSQGGEAVERVVQRNYGCFIIGDTQDQVEWGSGKPDSG